MMNNYNFKRKSSLVLLVLVVLLFFTPFVQVQAGENIPQASHEFYVYDEANIINEELSQYIIQINKDLYQQTGAQIVVAVINSLEGGTIEEYSNQLFREWGIGSSQENNGVLLLITLEEKFAWIEVGYGLEGAIPDGKAGEILDQSIIPYFRQEQYSQGILQGFQSILNIVEQEYQIGVSPQITPQNNHENTQNESQEMSLLQKILLIGAIIVFLFIDFTFFRGFLTFTLLRSLSRGRGGGGGNRGGGGSSGGGGAGRGW
jgi:uncharacterized protein